MQYIEGETLGVRLKRGRLAPGQALGLCARIADALQAAHARGIVHRDLKPQNVIMTSAEEPKLLDFGVAKRVTSSSPVSDDATESQLTHPLAAVGTPGYMAPEQIRHQIVDPQTDLFALGCVLFECLTGQRAFGGKTSEDVKASVLQRTPPSPSSLVPELGPAHDALVARLLKKILLTIQSADEVVVALRAFEPLSEPAAGRVSTTSGPRSLNRQLVLIGVLVAAVATVLMWLRPWDRAAPVAPPEAAGWYSRGVAALHEGRFAAGAIVTRRSRPSVSGLRAGVSASGRGAQRARQLGRRQRRTGQSGRRDSCSHGAHARTGAPHARRACFRDP